VEDALKEVEKLMGTIHDPIRKETTSNKEQSLMVTML
jgi:hypothetical protein